MTTWNELSAREGRNELPVILANAVIVDQTLTDASEIARGIAHAWTGAEFPERQLNMQLWLMLFDHVGYLDNGKPADPPAESITLYRGAIPRRKNGMSWTDSPKVAKWFAHRFDMISDQGRVYQLTVSPEALLAHLTEARGESEWVVDTTDYEHQIIEVEIEDL